MDIRSLKMNTRNSTSHTRHIDAMDEVMASVWRSKTPAERLAVAHGMWRFARDTLRNLLRAEHPDWTTEQVEGEAARRLSHGAS